MSRNLRILHCLRAPVGGLFRHVIDLAAEQARLGHDVGIIYDEFTSSPSAVDTLDIMAKYCRLGIRAVKMPRLLSPRDYFAYVAVKKFAKDAGVQVLHGHGGKGGAYARLAAQALNKDRQKCISIYTPHGGSLHYSPDSLSGKVFLTLEKNLVAKTNGLIFESNYSAEIFDKVIGRGFCPDRVIPNGLRADEFQPVAAEKNASDFVFIGELRLLKGVDVLLEAIANLRRDQQLTLSIVGDGPDEAYFRSMCRELNIHDAVQFLGRMPARLAFSKGRCVVVPSRAESFPYIVLEAGAALKPIIATDVGGISEIIPPTLGELVMPDDPIALGQAMHDFIHDSGSYELAATALQQSIHQKFTVEAMTSQITDFYLAILRR